MRKAVYLILTLACVSYASVSTAQEIRVPDYYTMGGYLMTRSDITPAGLASISQYNTAFGTARSAAMGGAFTSLGGDLSSINLNPAGLGMYRSSEIGFTPAFTFGKVKSTYPGMASTDGGNKTRFTLNNIGMALNLYQGSGALTSFTFGFTYNKLADYNYKSSVSLRADNSTIMDVFSNQLTWWGDEFQGVKPEWISGNDVWWDEGIYLNEWGAVLGYQTGIVKHEGNNIYAPYGMNNDTAIGHRMNTLSRGSIGEYSIAGGFNFLNKVYFGFGLGMQDIYQKQTIDYTENYNTPDYPDDVSTRVDRMVYSQETKVSGVGVNLKFGVIYRPLDALRIGVAVHTPTWVSTDRYYEAAMGARYGNGRVTSARTATVVSESDYRTPARLMAGISYAFGGRGIISFDYERTWYNGMRLRGDDYEYWNGQEYRTVHMDFKDAFKGNFQANNTFRVGTEFKPVDIVSLRAGFAYMGSMLKDDNVRYDTPIAYESYNASAGVGFYLGDGWSFDLAYVYTNTKYTDYSLYSYEYGYFDAYGNKEPEHTIGHQYGIGSERNAHNIILTFGYRF